jgi:hypothetical protein
MGYGVSTSSSDNIPLVEASSIGCLFGTLRLFVGKWSNLQKNKIIISSPETPIVIEVPNLFYFNKEKNGERDGLAHFSVWVILRNFWKNQRVSNVGVDTHLY